MSLVVLCPTRGRPDAMREAAQSLAATRLFGSTRIVAVIDHDDPKAEEYTRRASPLYDFMFPTHSGGMVAALNAGAMQLLEEHPEVEIVGFIGDDHRFRTKNWDKIISERLERRRGFAYADDAFRRDGDIATQVFINREIIEALGYMALPDCNHLYVDNAWRALADAAKARYYLPELLIEHMHPLIGKGQWDDGYRRVNAQSLYDSDRAAFEQWVASPRFATDVKKVRRAMFAAPTVSTR